MHCSAVTLLDSASQVPLHVIHANGMQIPPGLPPERLSLRVVEHEQCCCYLAGRSHLAPLVAEMLQRIQAEVQRYERVITYWPSFGPSLEAAVCAALRTTTAAVSRQCGLLPVLDVSAICPRVAPQSCPCRHSVASIVHSNVDIVCMCYQLPDC